MARRIRSYFVPALIALAAAGLLGVLYSSNTKTIQSTQNHVILGKDYYVTVSIVELSEKDPEGEQWDSYNNSGPDIYVEVYWKGHRIYQSTTKQDTFLARWSNAEIDLRNVALSGEGTSADSLIQGARLNIKENEKMEVWIYDSDLVDSDLVGVKEFTTSELSLGESTFAYKDAGIRRLVLRVSEMSDGAIQ